MFLGDGTGGNNARAEIKKYIYTQGCIIKDSDSDGVPDQWDKCPGTTSSSLTDSHGCKVSGLYTDEQVNQMVNQILDWDINKDGKIGLVEAIDIIRATSGVINSGTD